MTNAEARCNKSLRPQKPEGSLGRTAQDVHLDSHTAPELWHLSTCPSPAHLSPSPSFILPVHLQHTYLLQSVCPFPAHPIYLPISSTPISLSPHLPAHLQHTYLPISPSTCPYPAHPSPSPYPPAHLQHTYLSFPPPTCPSLEIQWILQGLTQLPLPGAVWRFPGPPPVWVREGWSPPPAPGAPGACPPSAPPWTPGCWCWRPTATRGWTLTETAGRSPAHPSWTQMRLSRWKVKILVSISLKPCPSFVNTNEAIPLKSKDPCQRLLKALPVLHEHKWYYPAEK